MPNLVRPDPSRRPFTLADIMILIAAIGLGLVGSRSFAAGLPFPYISPYDLFPFQPVVMTVPVASTLTLALIAVPVPTFRSRLRRLGRFPGMVACCGAATALLMIALHWTIRSHTVPYVGATAWIYYGQFTHQSLLWCGIGGVAALIVPALASCRRFRPDPIDWLRLAMGVYWVVMFLVVGGGLTIGKAHRGPSNSVAERRTSSGLDPNPRRLVAMVAETSYRLGWG